MSMGRLKYRMFILMVGDHYWWAVYVRAGKVIMHLMLLIRQLVQMT